MSRLDRLQRQLDEVTKERDERREEMLKVCRNIIEAHSAGEAPNMVWESNLARSSRSVNKLNEEIDEIIEMMR